MLSPEILLSGLTGVIIALGTNWIKEKFALKKHMAELAESEKRQDEKLDKREKQWQDLFSSRVEGLESRFVRLEHKVDDSNKLLKSHIDENDFRSEFKDVIRNKSRQILSLTHDFLTQDYKNILIFWADTIEKFGLDYYYSNKRKERKSQREKFFNEEIEAHTRNFYNQVDFYRESVRVYNGKKVIFSEYLDKVNIHNKTEFLKMELIKNGFKSHQEVIDKFADYIEDFFNDFMSCIVIWNRLELHASKHMVS